MSGYFLALAGLASGRKMPGAEPDSVIGQTLLPRPRSRFEPAEAASGEDSAVFEYMPFEPPPERHARMAASKVVKRDGAAPPPSSERARPEVGFATGWYHDEPKVVTREEKPVGRQPAKQSDVAESLERPLTAMAFDQTDNEGSDEPDREITVVPAPPTVEQAVSMAEPVEPLRSEHGSASADASDTPGGESGLGGGPERPPAESGSHVRVSIGRIEVVVEAPSETVTAPPDIPDVSAPQAFLMPPLQTTPTVAALAGTSGFDGYGARRRGRLR